MDSALIGQRLRQLRLARELTQADLAKQLAISPAYLNLLEKGRRTMQFPLLLRALTLLGADLEASWPTPPARLRTRWRTSSTIR
jgi:hypothetical protein